MITRRDFIKYSAYVAFLTQSGFLGNTALASPKAATDYKVSGQIVAACGNIFTSGPYRNEFYESLFVHLDLVTGDFSQIPIDLIKAHDTLKIRDNYLVIPNKHTSKMHVTNLDGDGQDIFIREDVSPKGHAFHDEKNDVIVVSSASYEDNLQGYFGIFDTKTFKLIDMIKLDGHAPHDIQLYDENTLAVCNYNIDSLKTRDETGYGIPPKGGYSELVLFDRDTYQVKEKIPAYKTALISHSVITNNGDLYAIGFDEYDDQDIENWTNQYIEEKFKSYYEENHPELLSQWPDIAHSLKIHSVEKAKQSFGMPLLPMKMNAGKRELSIMQQQDFHHRRAQSICYVQKTNTVCFSYPNSDSVQLYNATTGEFKDLRKADLNLKEMRGICEIKDTPYLAVAGTRRGVTIVDTRNLSILNHYDVVMGAITHMHHVA